MQKQLPMPGSQSFEKLKQNNAHGAEYWSARDLQPLLGYSQWRRFEDAVKRAMTSCEASGNSAGDHFASAGKPIEVGIGGQRQVEDYHLSRFACYQYLTSSRSKQRVEVNNTTHKIVTNE